MRRPTKMLGLALMLLGTEAAAVTWIERDIRDPLNGQTCKVQDLASAGSYIYEWPEKFDQVFIPVTAAEGLWYCKGSGFASFIGDTTLQPIDQERLLEFLRHEPEPTPAAPDVAWKLQRAESLYALREMPAERQALIHRILAYTFEALGNDPSRARLHRQAALRFMLERLADESLSERTRLEYLFVSSNYLREFGDSERADRLLTQLQAQIAASTGEGSGYPAYLLSLVPEARNITPGGALAPEPATSP